MARVNDMKVTSHVGWPQPLPSRPRLRLFGSTSSMAFSTSIAAPLLACPYRSARLTARSRSVTTVEA